MSEQKGSEIQIKCEAKIKLHFEILVNGKIELNQEFSVFHSPD